MKKKLLLAVVVLCLVAVGAEISIIFENGLREVEELLFSLLLIAFWLSLVMYLFNSLYFANDFRKSWFDKNEHLTDI